MADVLSVPEGSPAGAITPGAIIGENPTPYGAAILQDETWQLTTGDLDSSSLLDVGGLSNFAVEFWLRAEGGPPSSWPIVAGPLSSQVSATLRQWQVGLNSAKQIYFQVADAGGTAYTAVGATSLNLEGVSYQARGGWAHVLCTADSSSLLIYLNGVLDVSTSWSGTGVCSIANASFPAGQLDLRVTGVPGALVMIDNLALYRSTVSVDRALAHYVAGVARGFPYQYPGERIISALDAVGSTAPRSWQRGTRPVIPRYMSGQAPVAEMRTAVEAEDVDAALFANASGAVVFLADGHRSSGRWNTIQSTFGDNPAAGELPYVDIVVDYSPSHVVNEYSLTRSPFGPIAPLTVTVQDSSSISSNFRRAQALSDVPTADQTALATIGARLLAKYAIPFQRVTSIELRSEDAATCAALLRLELMDKIRVLRTPPGGGARISQDLYIQQIELQGSNSGAPFSARLGVSPL